MVGPVLSSIGAVLESHRFGPNARRKLCDTTSALDRPLKRSRITLGIIALSHKSQTISGREKKLEVPHKPVLLRPPPRTAEQVCPPELHQLATAAALGSPSSLLPHNLSPQHHTNNNAHTKGDGDESGQSQTASYSSHAATATPNHETTSQSGEVLPSPPGLPDVPSIESQQPLRLSTDIPTDASFCSIHDSAVSVDACLPDHNAACQPREHPSDRQRPHHAQSFRATPYSANGPPQGLHNGTISHLPANAGANIGDVPQVDLSPRPAPNTEKKWRCPIEAAFMFNANDERVCTWSGTKEWAQVWYVVPERECAASSARVINVSQVACLETSQAVVLQLLHVV
jgi:hypothetical protein